MSPPVLEVKAKQKKKANAAAGGADGSAAARQKKRGAEGAASGGGGGGGAGGVGGAKRPKQDVGGGQAWEMGTDAVKGRIMLATRDLEVGDVVLVEKPLVAASWHEHRCLECHGPHAASTCEEVAKRYPKAVASKMEDIEAALGTISGGEPAVLAAHSLRAVECISRLRVTLQGWTSWTFVGGSSSCSTLRASSLPGQS